MDFLDSLWFITNIFLYYCTARALLHQNVSVPNGVFYTLINTTVNSIYYEIIILVSSIVIFHAHMALT